MTKSRDLGNLAQTVAVNLPTSLGTAGQTLVVNSGADGLEFGAASGGSGVTVYTGLSGTDGTPTDATYLLNASSPSAGDLAYVTANTSLYQNNGNGWYRIAVINTTPTISSVADASSNTTPFTLEGGTNTVITVTASDADEGTDLTYSHSVTSGSLNGTTVTQGTGANENVFTIAPHASNATTFSITFTVSDSINAATSVAAFTLEFVIADSHYTSLLMGTDGSAGDNNDITDSSSSSHTITVNGDAHAGTFSPYRHGGYSTYFDGNDYLAVTKSTDLDLDTNNWTIECWLNLTNPSATQAVYSFGYETQTTRGCIIYLYGGNLHFAYSTTGSNNTDTSMGSHGIVANEWTHLSVVRNGSTITGYINGAALGTTINIGASDIYYPSSGSVRIGGDGTNFVTGYISDFRLVNGTAVYSGAFTPPSGPLTATGGTYPSTTNVNTSITSGHTKLLLKGTDAHVIDKSQRNNLKLVGTAASTSALTSGSTPPYIGAAWANTSAVSFDGNSDYVIMPQISLGGGDFTIEAYTYLDARLTSYPAIFSNYSSFAAGALGLFAGHGSSTTTNYQVAHNGAGFPAINGGPITYDQWVHLCVERYNGTITLYKDGSSVNSFSSTATLNGVGSNFYIGTTGDSISTGYLNGWIQDFRVTVGKARYQGAFTKPAAPLKG